MYDAPLVTSEIFTGAVQLVPPLAELRYQVFQASKLPPFVCMYQARTSVALAISTDGGVTWTAPVKISDVTSGASYKTANGFLEPYGDYGETAITSAGKTIATWGEGNSYTGPGGVWFNRQT